jgi:integrase
VSVERALPRFVIAKPVAGSVRYYWTLPSYYRKLGCTLHKEHETALGDDYEAACGVDGKGGKAAILNALFDEWDRIRLGEPVAAPIDGKIGTVDWLFRAYKASNDWEERVSARTAPDHERTMDLVANIRGKSGQRIGDKMITAITPAAADKLYARVRETPIRKGKKERPRTAEKVVAVCRHAWKVVRRLHPGLFIQGPQVGDVPVWNPWEGVALRRRQKAKKPAATRDEVYAFAWAAVEAGHADAAAAAVICFEWLQRPENVLAGHVTWNGYRTDNHPDQIRIEHHKTGEMVLHPLEEAQLDLEAGTRTRVLFYEEAEEILAHLPRLGPALVMRKTKAGGRLWDIMQMGRLVRSLRERFELPATFTLDACRHGGMTELEEAELTDGQGRALSAHRSRAYEGYAKRTAKRALAATKKRHAYKVAEAAKAAEFPAENQFQKSQAL